jgi:hypothetical protein
MSSTINPNNINGAYPVAGQDNDSQGFRDNFTNTKTNFQAAATEITDLQNKVVLKAALTGTTLNNDMGGSILSNAQLQDMSETVVSIGSVSGSQTVNYAVGSYQTLTMTGSVSFSITNWPPAGQLGRIRLQVTCNNLAHTLTFPASVTIGVSNIQGLVTSTNILTFNKTGTYEFELENSQGQSSTAVTIIDQNRNLDPIYLPSSEDLANAGAASLAVTASYFSTAAAETATLAAGANGQIKTFMMVADSGDMVITVTNAGWKTSGTGTITFDAIGDGCTLQYINSKWFCIGNNSVTFA